MSNALERDNFDSNDTGLRDSIEASIAQHSTSPDVDSIVNGAVEERNVELRSRNLDRWGNEKVGKSEIRGGNPQDRRQQAIRAAFQSAKEKAAAPPGGTKASFEIEPGPPKTWDKTAQADWPNLSHATKQAILRTDRETFDALDPHFRKYRELDAAIGPHRHVFPPGVSEPQAISNVLGWAAALRGPNKNMAAAQLLNEVGVSLQDLVAITYGKQPQYEQQYQQQYQQPDYAAMQHEQQVHQVLSQFSQGRPHFEKVRYAMGMAIQNNGARYMLADGNVNLQAVYDDCVRAVGLDSNNRRRNAASVSTRGRAPSGRSESSSQSGSSVRQSINNAIMEARG